MAAKARKLHKPYPKPGCPNCGAIFKPGQLRTGEVLCSACNATFQAAIFQPPPEIFRIRRIDANAAAAPEIANPESGEALAGSAVDSPCAAHPLNAAEGICDRCGIFICALCRIPVGGKGFCPACFERQLQEGGEDFEPERLPNDRGIARICAVAGLIPYVGLLMGPVSLFYAIRALNLWRKGSATPGGLGGLIVILLFGLAETAGNVALAWWMASLMYKGLGSVGRSI